MKKINFKNKKFVAIAIIFDTASQSVLFQHRSATDQIQPNKWGFFGGHNLENELPKQTLIREIKEETGFVLKETDIKYFMDYPVSRGLHRYVYIIDTFPKNFNIILGDQAQAYAWIPINQLAEYDLTETSRIDLNNFLPLANKYY